MSKRDLNTPEPKHVLIPRLLAEAMTPRPHEVSVGDALEFRRDAYGLKRDEWCLVIGMQPSHYSEVLSGRRQLPREAMLRAYAVGVPAEVLLQNRP